MRMLAPDIMKCDANVWRRLCHGLAGKWQPAARISFASPSIS